MDDITPRLGWPHLLMFVPGLGAAAVAVMATSREGSEKAELLQAAKWQGGAFSIVALHGALQAAIWFVEWLFASVPPEIAAGSPMNEHVPLLLSLCTHGNVTAMVAEWGVLAWFGFKASRGNPYPSRAKKRA